MDSEQRKTPRRILRVRAHVEIAGRQLMTRTHDLSTDGISILLPFPPPRASVARIQFTLLSGSTLHTIVLTAKLTHCTLSADEFRSGFAIVQIADKDQQLVNAFCKG